jgi:hypothetical protein
MNGEFLGLVAPKFTIGTWENLTGEQQRIFITYIRFNFGADVGVDPAAFAARLWDDSVSAANSSSTPASDRLLNLSRLTTFVGVTSMWEKRKVINLVTLVTNINGDQQNANFRLFGELVANSETTIRKQFDQTIFGSGHGEYSVSRREQGLWGQPNGQFSLTKDWHRFDSDVDYRRLFNPAHNTKDNSDIRAFDGSKSHLQRHIGRYGSVPISMQDVHLGPPSVEALFVSADVQAQADPKLLEISQATSVASAFVERFKTTLTLDGLFEEMFATGAITYLKSSGFFAAMGLADDLVSSLPDTQLIRVYKQLMDFYYLRCLFELRTEFLGLIALGERTEESPAEVQALLSSAPQLRVLVNEDAMDISKIHTAELEELMVVFERASSAYRERLMSGEGRSELLRANVRSINAQRQHPYHIDTVESDVGGEAAPENSYTVEQGIFVVQMVKEDAALKILNLGIGA